MTRPRMPQTTRWLAVITVSTALASTVPALTARAVPRGSARYEQDCLLCHVNPSGGGMRSAYASQDLVPKEFAMWRSTPEALAMLDAHLGKNVSLGTDMRELFMVTTAN